MTNWTATYVENSTEDAVYFFSNDTVDSFNDTNFTIVTGYCPLRLNTINIVMLVMITVIFMASVIGNLLVILTILQTRWMRNVTNVFLLNLAVSDLLLTIICMPPTLSGTLFQCFFAAPFFCNLIIYMQPVSVSACSFTLVAIALERYKAICQPLHSRHWKTKSHALAMIFTVWILAFLSSIPSAVTANSSQYKPGKYNCRTDWDDKSVAIYTGFLTVALFLIPLVLMVILYSLVISTLWKGMQMEQQSSPADSSDKVVGKKLLQEETSAPVRSSRSSSVPRIVRAMAHNVRGKTASSWNILARQRFAVIVQTRTTVPSSTSTSSNVNMIKNENRKIDNVALRSTHTERSLLAKKRVIKMLVAIVVEFFVCWMPLYVQLLYTSWSMALGIAPADVGWMRAGFLILAYLSTCTNPITYCFLNVKFRQALLITIGCKSMVKDISTFNNTTIHYPPSDHNAKRSGGGGGGVDFNESIAEDGPTTHPPRIYRNPNCESHSNMSNVGRTGSCRSTSMQKVVAASNNETGDTRVFLTPPNEKLGANIGSSDIDKNGKVVVDNGQRIEHETTI